MCDPVSILMSVGTGLAGSAVVGALTKGGGGSTVDPAKERAEAEAKAAQAANARIAATQRRRQQSLLSSGAPATDPAAPTASRSTTSLMARGAQMGGGSGQVIL
jgi:hypothetical protein